MALLSPSRRTDEAGEDLLWKMAICCKVCGKESVIMDPYSSDDLEVNTRSLVAARMMGKGRNGLATFAGIMGMPSPLTRPHILLHNEVIQRASSSESQANMLAAAAHLREMHKAKDDGRQGHLWWHVAEAWPPVSVWCCHCSMILSITKHFNYHFRRLLEALHFDCSWSFRSVQPRVAGHLERNLSMQPHGL